MGSELVAGIDGAKGGWEACVVDLDTAMVAFTAGPTLASVWDRAWCVVGIDMPIGLPSGQRRPADAEARALLGRRGSTLFPTPDHALLPATDYQDAQRRSRTACGRGVSQQAFHLLPKIREVRTLLDGPTDGVYEVHPETSFTVMNGDVPLVAKTSTEGRTARMELLTAELPALASCAGGLSIDALDAAAAAWTATRIARGQHRLFGGPDCVDPDGYPLFMAA